MIIASHSAVSNSPPEISLPPVPPLDLMTIVRIEPYISCIIADAWTANLEKRNCWKVYEAGKKRLLNLVGWHARKELLRTEEAYDIVLSALLDAVERRGRMRFQRAGGRAWS